MTAPKGEHTLAPESSDGFASVGTASHRKRVALLPGGPFYLWKTGSKSGKRACFLVALSEGEMAARGANAEGLLSRSDSFVLAWLVPAQTPSDVSPQQRPSARLS